MAERKSTQCGILAVSIIILLTQAICAAEITSSTDKNSLSLGERLHFQVTITTDKGSECIPPEPEQYLKTILVKEWNISKKESVQTDSFIIDYILTTYIPENCTIPSLPFVLQNSSSIDTLYTDQIALQFLSVITGNDSTIDIKSLKPQQNAGVIPKWWLWITIFLAGTALLVIGILYLTKRFRKTPPPPPLVPPYEEAVMALGILHGKRLLEKGLVREYVFELSEIFKRYIERRFLINASEFTTEEMIAWSGVSGIDKNLKKSLEWFFYTTDPVKFARIIPDSVTTDRFTTEVTSFLEATKPVINQSNDTEHNMRKAVQESESSLPPQQKANENNTTQSEVR